jgi:hypothetical protein
MSLLEEPPTHRSPFRVVSIAVGVVAAAAALAWVLWSRGTVREAPRSSRPPSAPRTPAEPSATPAPAPRREVSRPAPKPAPSSPHTPAEATRPAAEAPRGVLRVRSDVTGASVFLDRKFLGTTPLEVDGLEPGSYRLNISAEGYDGQVRTVEIGGEPAEVTVAFKEVRLDAAVPVVHKHGVGSCQGRLIASLAGLRYETTSDDAFALSFAELEAFDVDYLKKNLRVKRRGGKTWNFTDPGGSADPLFVFHRDVEKVRTKK